MPMSVVYTNFDGQIVHENRGGVERTYVSDPQGSTIALLDEDGNVTDTFDYWPYGEVSDRTGTTPTPFGYVGTLGYYEDPDGSLYVRARDYRPELARWQTVDPLWPDESAYVYCDSSPVMLTDVFGLQAKRPKPHLLPPHGGGIGGGFDYGSFCGPANKRNPSWRVLPQDCVDACCLNHDRCLEAHYGAGFGGISAHGCCDSGLSDCVERLSYDCCHSSPTPLGCMWAIKTIRFSFNILRKNPFRFFGCLPSSKWGVFCHYHWGGSGECQEKSLANPFPPKIRPSSSTCPEKVVPGPVLPGMPIPRQGGGFSVWQ